MALMFWVAWFLMRFALDDQIMELVELLPKILTSLNTSHGIATAFQCLGKHGQLEAALQCLSLLKKNGEREQLLGHYLIALILGYTKGKKVQLLTGGETSVCLRILF
jgi:pentatricopeptide repeat protein